MSEMGTYEIAVSTAVARAIEKLDLSHVRVIAITDVARTLGDFGRLILDEARALDSRCSADRGPVQ